MRTMACVLAATALAGCPPVGASSSATGPTSPTGTAPATSPGPVTDEVLQTRYDAVDALFVVQTTAGMAEAQATVAGHVPYLFDYLLGSGIDYHLGVVTADLDDPATAGLLREADGLEWVDVDTANPVGVLAAMIEAGELGSPTVQALGAAFTAAKLERTTGNSGFFRDDAAFHVISVGDGTDATDPALVDAAGFVTWMEDLEPVPGDRGLHCVLAVGATGVVCGEVAALLGGVTGDLLSAGEALEGVGLEVSGLDRVFALSRLPVAGTITVAVEDVSGAELAFAEGVDWTHDPVANAVVFLEYVPNGGATVRLTYEAL